LNESQRRIGCTVRGRRTETYF